MGRTIRPRLYRFVPAVLSVKQYVHHVSWVALLFREKSPKVSVTMVHRIGQVLTVGDAAYLWVSLPGMAIDIISTSLLRA
ncbi:hypothetical protein APT59_07380 [Pseudomonas oryzihabitans]|uniref:Uncharacterized protein n=1 Tax=Pseudomonas oryzihabitans TaxID=47885 RepID=A0A0U4VLT3_9PSED|nr:hypothetical protein APT59_07380 [Pseudomonas oryzihabitans]